MTAPRTPEPRPAAEPFLTGRTALVTGAAGGIGSACAPLAIHAVAPGVGQPLTGPAQCQRASDGPEGP
ncbi:3-hydroxybutyrate dehydrogenase, partial [Streptomyces albidoflavus]